MNNYQQEPQGFMTTRQETGVQAAAICPDMGQLMRHCRNNPHLKITGGFVHPQQIPSEQNGFVAVVVAGIETSQGRFECLGAAQPEDEHSRNVQRLVDSAAAQGLRRACAFVQAASGQESGPVLDASPVQAKAEQKPAIANGKPEQRVIRHSTTRPASPGQFALIRTMSAERNMSEEEARKAANVPVSGRISSSQANDVITALKEIQRTNGAC